MRNTLVKSLAGLSALSLGILGSVGFAQRPTEALAAASSSSSSVSVPSCLTPGNLVYLDIPNANAPWYTGIPASSSGGTSQAGLLKYAFIFYTSTTATFGSGTYSAFASRAQGGQRFYCAIVPSKTGVTTWAAVRAVVFDSTSTATTDGKYLAYSKIIYATQYDGFSFTNSSTVGTLAAPASEISANQMTYVDANISTNKTASWASTFLAETTTICSGSNIKTNLDYYWATYSSSYASIVGSFTNFTSATASFAPNTTTATNTIASAAGRYDYIRWKYSSDATLTNFAGRTLLSKAPGANPVSLPAVSSSSDGVLIVSLAVLAAFAAGGYFFLKKKKEA